MEISEIQRALLAEELQKKKSPEQTQLSDQLLISSDCEKKAAWIRKLKKMSNVHSEKIEVTCNVSPSSRILAQQILNSHDVLE